MTDPTAFASALTAVKAAFDIAKGIRAAGTSMEKAELQLKIGELATLLSDARASMVDAQEENLDLRRKVMELEQEKATREAMTFRKDAYWRTTSSGEDGPYCARCFEADKKSIHLRDLNNGYLFCPDCNRTIDSPNAPPPPRTRYVIDDGPDY